MAEQMQHDGNPDFIKQHPDAIVDPAQAEIYGHAAKNHEEAVVFSGKLAAEQLAIIEDPRASESEKQQAESTARAHIDASKRSRKQADRAGSSALESHEKTDGIREEIDRIKSGHAA